MIKKKSLIICIFVSLFIILAILLYNLFNMFYKKTVFENDVLAFWNKNQKTIFSINKCVFFTSCNAKNKTSSNTNFTIENLYQYTDIALFINNNSEENNLENNNDVLTFLYGYIMHYALDTKVHPYVIHKAGIFNKKKKDLLNL